ncbi:MAG: O-antigen ligase family protein [Rhodospirillaceae bacterium]|nr:O-antigen ligase family protein [Rhodospirillaceae bacterium]
MTSATARPITILCGLVFLIGPLAAVARQGLVPLLFIALVTLAFVPEARAIWRVLHRAKLLLFAAPFLGWTLLSNLWSPTLQVGPWAQMATILLGAVLVATGVAALNADAAQRLMKAALMGVLVLLVFLLEESMTEAAVMSWARPEDVQQADATFFSLIMSLAARGTAVLALLSAVAAGGIYALTRSPLAVAAFILAGLAACTRLPQTTSALGFVAAIVAVVLVYARPRLFLGLMLAGLGVALLAAGPAARAIPDPNTLSTATNQLELGAQHRLGIWRYVADLSAEAPVIGHGYNSARYFAARQDKLEGLGLPALPTHPHNVPLQIWLELGGVGALLAAVAVFGFWRGLQPVLARPLHAALVAGLIAPAGMIAGFSFSVWSYWWLAALGFAASLCALTMKLLPAKIAR